VALQLSNQVMAQAFPDTTKNAPYFDPEKGYQMRKIFNLDFFRGQAPPALVPMGSPDVYLGGNYRFIGFGGRITQGYPGQEDNARRLLLRDPFNEPLLDLFMRIGSEKVKFGTQLRFFTDYNGPSQEGGVQRTNVNFGITLTGEIPTSFGTFNLAAGGIQWAALSNLTLSGNRSGNNRTTLFDRLNGENAGDVKERYDNYYRVSAIQNLRPGSRPFQGINLSGRNMPWGTSFNFLFGKTDQNGGFNSFQRPNLPNQFWGGQFRKTTNKGYLAINHFDNTAARSLEGNENANYELTTLETDLNFEGFNFNAETGLGSFSSPTYEKRFSEGLILNLRTPSKVTGIPFSFQAYRLGVNFVNLNGNFNNISIPEANQQVITFLAAQPFNLVFAPTLRVGAFSNNRQAISANTEVALGNFRLNAGWSMATDLEKRNTKIVNAHNLNGFAYSRFNPGNRGPYNRILSFFAAFLDEVNLKDVDGNGNPLYLLKYNALEGQLKYKGTVGTKNFYLFLTGMFNSVQNREFVLPMMNSKAYLHNATYMYEAYFQVKKWLMLGVSGGHEISKGNERTDLNTLNIDNIKNPPTLKPRDQLGRSLGLSADFSLASNMGLFIRHRWFDYRDRNFADEKFIGHETMVELKVLFW
jgi:hypothetical protein